MITFVKDCLGSVRGVVDLSGGTVLERNDYYAYGERVADSTMQTTSINRWRYNANMNGLFEPYWYYLPDIP